MLIVLTIRLFAMCDFRFSSANDERIVKRAVAYVDSLLKDGYRVVFNSSSCVSLRHKSNSNTFIVFVTYASFLVLKNRKLHYVESLPKS